MRHYRDGTITPHTPCVCMTPHKIVKHIIAMKEKQFSSPGQHTSPSEEFDICYLILEV